MFEKPVSNLTYKDINELLYLKKEREGQRLDYKRDFYKDTKEFTKDIVAFANTEGGYIIFGINEKENIVCGIIDNIGGTKIDDWIANVINTNTSEPIKYETKFIPIGSENIHFIFVLFIQESLNKPLYATENQKSICYIRRGSSIFAAKPIEIKQMYETTAKLRTKRPVNILQSSKGNNNLQIGINQGTIIKTHKITKRNEVIPNPETHITQEQAKQILEAVNKIVELNEKAGKFKTPKDKGICFSQTWTSFKNRFNVTSYHLLPKDQFDQAIDWLKKQIAYEHRPKLRKSNNSEWRKEMFKAIYAKAQSNSMEKEELYNFIQNRLSLKAPISSLKELSDVRLSKVYKLIFSN